MRTKTFEAFRRGMLAALPVGIGYFAVSFTLGIVMRNAGLSAFQGFFMSLTNNTSAGEAASLEIIKNNGSYFEIALSQLVINLRYFLMSAALLSAVPQDLPLRHRFFVAFDITDETFALNLMQNRPFSPYYAYGVMVTTIPFWALGTMLGIIFGNILPQNVVSALSVALYAMFIAVIIPPAKKEKKLYLVILISMLCSAFAASTPYIKTLSSGSRIIILTVALSALFAIIMPRESSGER